MVSMVLLISSVFLGFQCFRNDPLPKLPCTILQHSVRRTLILLIKVLGSQRVTVSGEDEVDTFQGKESTPKTTHLKNNPPQ